MLSFSLVITTYNRPQALRHVLLGLAQQRNAADFEVIIADDGSTAATVEQLTKLQLPYSVKHCWQADQGFRAARCRNFAVSQSQGSYLLFLDGDCIPAEDFLLRHQGLTEAGWFVSGNRLLLSEQLTEQVLANHIDVSQWSLLDYWQHYRRGDLNRLLPLLRLPDGAWRKRRAQRWHGAKTCNLGIWREDFIAVNGFDESFIGWGHEDAELVARLLNHGVQHKDGRFATGVWHLWHAEQPREQEQDNWRSLQEAIAQRRLWAEQGIAEYQEQVGDRVTQLPSEGVETSVSDTPK